MAEFTEQFVVVQVKEKEITYKRLREENEFAQKVIIFLCLLLKIPTLLDAFSSVLATNLL